MLAAQTTVPLAPRVPGYFNAASLPDLRTVVPPAPAAGDARDQIDRAVFKATRSMEGSERWQLAHEDNDLSTAGLLRIFSCSVGLKLTDHDAPHLAKLLTRVSTDSNAVNVAVKDRYKRKRPFLVDEGPTCIDKIPSLVNAFDYPSGHTTMGWLTGLILAEIAPEHATAILVRARSYGESRLICGVHNASAVESGRMLGSALFAVLESEEAFRHDMSEARKETKELSKKSTAANPMCAGEAALIEQGAYSLPVK